MSYATILAGFASFFYADSCRRFDFWLIRNPFRDHFLFYSGEARGLVFWAVDPVWSPPQAPGVEDYYYDNKGLLLL